MLKTALLSALLLTSCATTAPVPAFTLTSPAFAEGDSMPESTVLNGLACSGPDRSPALQWTDAPAGTRSFVVILDDYEARMNDGFIHWAAYNIPGTATGLPETPAPRSPTSPAAGGTPGTTS